MTHTAHRYGTEESLKNDYTFYARASRWVNREGCGPKFMKILDIFLSEKPVNFSFTSARKSFASGLDPKDSAATASIDKALGVCCNFSNKASVRAVLKKLKEADTGISIVTSGLINEITEIAKDLDLTPHTALLSLGIFGKKARLPEERVLEVTTMCGHGLVATNLTKTVIDKVKQGKMTPKQGAHLLAQPCPCGIFNTDRCEVILEQCRDESQ